MEKHYNLHWAMEKAALRLLILRGFVTVLALAGAVWVQSLTVRQLPFHVDMKSNYAVVIPRPGIALPSGIAADDHIPLAAQSIVSRAVLIASNVPSDRTYPLVIAHDGHSGTVLVRTVAVPGDGRYMEVIGALTLLAVLLVGLITLWRGRDWAAWGLSIFAISIIIGNMSGNVPRAPFGNIVGFIGQDLMTGPAVFLGLYLTATSLVASDRKVNRRGLRAYIGLLAVGAAVEFTPSLLILFTSRNYLFTPLEVAGALMALVSLVVPLVVLTRGFVAAQPDQRLRIKWVLAGSALLVPLLLSEFWSQAYSNSAPIALEIVAAARGTLGALIFAIYAFAVLSARLVDVRIVINRAVVFTVLMGLVVGLLALVESLIENSALHGRVGLALEVAAPLILGIAFDQLQRRIEQVVDRVFFRREHRARESMRDFVRDAGFVEQPDVLVARIVAVFDSHSGGHGAALFEARTGIFERTAEHGNCWPEMVDGDDPALVRLRATLLPLDLHGIESACGAEGIALPLALRGRLFGVMICGPRSAGRYAQAEMVELAQSARDVGASLFALRARANETLVERLALGQIKPKEATIEARLLTGMSP
jgi:hypothetical protein